MKGAVLRWLQPDIISVLRWQAMPRNVYTKVHPWPGGLPTTVKLLNVFIDNRVNEYSTSQLVALTALRVLIGWHFLYEGVVKYADPDWSSASYLKSTQGPLSVVFQKIAVFPPALELTDLLNTWGLILIGVCLILGLFSVLAYFLGLCLLALYYVSMPPLIGYTFASGVEGSYLLVNKIIIEMSALFVLWCFPTGNQTGLDMFVQKIRMNGEE